MQSICVWVIEDYSYGKQTNCKIYLFLDLNKGVRQIWYIWVDLYLTPNAHFFFLENAGDFENIYNLHNFKS